MPVALLDLLTGLLNGFGAVVVPIIGALLGWLALQRGAPRNPSLGALAANVAVLALFVVAVFLFGGA